MKNLILLTAMFSSMALAGGTGGGSTPPMSQPKSIAILDVDISFGEGSGDPCLIVESSLAPNMVLSMNDDSPATQEKVRELSALIAQTHILRAVDGEGKRSASYRIDSGDTVGSYVLTERRTLLRDQRDKHRAAVLPK